MLLRRFAHCMIPFLDSRLGALKYVFRRPVWFWIIASAVVSTYLQDYCSRVLDQSWKQCKQFLSKSCSFILDDYPHHNGKRARYLVLLTLMAMYLISLKWCAVPIICAKSSGRWRWRWSCDFRICDSCDDTYWRSSLHLNVNARCERFSFCAISLLRTQDNEFWFIL